MTYKNQRYIEQMDKRLDEALQDIVQKVQNVGNQTASNIESQSQAAPLAPQSLSVTASSGLFKAVIADTTQQGKAWVLQYSTSPSFGSVVTVDLGISQNWQQGGLSGQTLYFRCYSTFYTSPPSSMTYYGTPRNPTPVKG